jgi:site-specific DNA-cytosine methylase
VTTVEVRHFHLFCGLGGAAAGFNRGQARVGTMTARFRCLGGVDSNPAAVNDFGRLAGIPGTPMDLFDREQYKAWHGHEPPAGWREATPEDLRRAAGNEPPDIVFTSPPCKGFSGLLSERLSASPRYNALNRLTVRGVWLALEAWADDPPAFLLLENVPRIANRGIRFLDRIEALLQRYGYAVARTTHDCGELGGLSQIRRRFLLVARHTEKVPPNLYEPPIRPLRSVGSTLERFRLPDDPAAGPMHGLPALQWRTWVRLAFVEAGSDWRSLERLKVDDGGCLANHLIVPRMYRSGLGVTPWSASSGTITGDARPSKGAFAVADPRRAVGRAEFGQYGVRRWDEVSGVVSGQSMPGGGRYSVADPRTGLPEGNKYGHYGVVPWTEPGDAVTAAGSCDNGRFSAADPRLPGPDDQVRCCILAEDGTWHRPFTTLELAALQGLVNPDEHLELDGSSHSAWRERIGNAVPPPAAAAIASTMAEALLLAKAGETFVLSAAPAWVRPVATALAVRSPVDAEDFR